MTRGKQGRAAALSRKDAAKKKAQKAPSDIETSSDSDVERAAAAEARKNRERELKWKVTAALEDN